MENDEVRKTVRDAYAKVARSNKVNIETEEKKSSCCGSSSSGKIESSSCCGSSSSDKIESSSCCGSSPRDISKSIGYSLDEMNLVPEGSNLGLGCGNPTAIAGLKEGDVVLDLGSGAGFDCFLASRKVGDTGKVIGVDMTPDMIDLARKNAKINNYTNVEFRLGEIENIPAADNSVDLVMSNCVINLSPEKQKVFDEAYRVLKPDGRITISDLVLLKPLPKSIKNSKAALASCVAGAVLKDKYLEYIMKAGFKEIEIVEETSTKTGEIEQIASIVPENDSLFSEHLENINELVQSITVVGVKK